MTKIAVAMMIATVLLDVTFYVIIIGAGVFRAVTTAGKCCASAYNKFTGLVYAESIPKGKNRR